MCDYVEKFNFCLVLIQETCSNRGQNLGLDLEV